MTEILAILLMAVLSVLLQTGEGRSICILCRLSGGEAKQLTNVGSPKWVGHVWSQDSKTIYLRHYDPGKSDPKVRIQAVSVPDGSMRKVLDLDNIAIEVSWASMATDGEKLYFIQRRPFGDIWLAELMYE